MIHNKISVAASSALRRALFSFSPQMQYVNVADVHLQKAYHGPILVNITKLKDMSLAEKYVPQAQQWFYQNLKNINADTSEVPTTSGMSSTSHGIPQIEEEPDTDVTSDNDN